MTTFLSRGYCCGWCRARITNERAAVELVAERTGSVVGPFCDDDCASDWVAFGAAVVTSADDALNVQATA